MNNTHDLETRVIALRDAHRAKRHVSDVDEMISDAIVGSLDGLLRGTLGAAIGSPVRALAKKNLCVNGSAAPPDCPANRTWKEVEEPRRSERDTQIEAIALELLNALQCGYEPTVAHRDALEAAIALPLKPSLDLADLAKNDQGPRRGGSDDT